MVMVMKCIVMINTRIVWKTQLCQKGAVVEHEAAVAGTHCILKKGRRFTRN